jgi:hypothetical protein
MKTISYSGAVFIQTSQNFRSGRNNFATFPKAGAGTMIDDYAAGFSGTWYVFFLGTLKDGSIWYYPYAQAGDEFGAIRILANLESTNYPGLNRIAAGEWYNHVYRANTFAKVSPADWNAWLFAH